MNQRDRLWIQREYIALASWWRDGRTFPNTLGFKRETVEYALMRGETGGDVHGKSKVPTRFNDDTNIRKLDRAYWRMGEKQQCTISLIFYKRKSERDAAACLGVTRHVVRQWLNDAYQTGYQALTTKDNQSGIASG